MSAGHPRVAVVGGGISGLTAAYRLRRLLGPAASITVFESTGRLGGKIRTALLGGVPVDVGAEAFLVRRPEAVRLVEELGLSGELVHATSARPTVRAGGRSRPLPRRTLMGIPADAGEVAGVLSAEGLATVAAEAAQPPPTLPAADIGLGELLRGRFGDELVDRLVNPLLGGVYGAGADALGLRAVLPPLAAAVDDGAPSLTAAAAQLLPPVSDAPVFGTLRGGLGVLVDRLADAAAADVVAGVPVQSLERGPHGWVLTAGGRHEVDGVVLAVPAPAARRLLDGVSPEAARAYAEVDQASMAVVTVALPAGTELPPNSGVLVEEGQHRSSDPAGSPLLCKAMTFSSRKWQHVGERGVLLRASVGRFGAADDLRLGDDALIDGVLADLRELTGVTAEPSAVLVQRWGGGLPHYGVRQLEQAARIERAVAELPGLEVAGAVLRGVGIPACIGTGDDAARRLAAEVTVRN